MERPPFQRQVSRVRFAEEEEGGEAAKEEAGPRAPSVFWADDRTEDRDPDNDANLSHYTFYREGTPTPPEYDEREKSPFGYGIAVGGPGSEAVEAAQGDDGMFPPQEMVREDEDERSRSSGESQDSESGARKRHRWLVILVAALFVIVPVSVGVGLGVGLNKSTTVIPPSSASPVTTGLNSTVPATSTVQTSPTSTSSSSSTSSAEPTQGTNTDCPSANNTIYEVPGSTKKFLRTCGIDYSGAGGATDLLHVYTDSMADCMNTCASYDRCTGCGWGVVAGDRGQSHRCWMKDNLQTPHKAGNDYCFAVLQ